MIRSDTLQESLVFFRTVHRMELGIHAESHVQKTVVLAFCCTPDKGSIFRIADEIFSRILYAVPLPGNFRNSLSKVQQTLILCNVLRLWFDDHLKRHIPAVVFLAGGNMKVRQRQIRLKPTAFHLIVDDSVGLFHIAL